MPSRRPVVLCWRTTVGFGYEVGQAYLKCTVEEGFFLHRRWGDRLPRVPFPPLLASLTAEMVAEATEEW